MPKYMVLGLLICLSNPANAFDPCKPIVKHEPRADVNHTPSTIAIPERVKIPITIDLAERYGIDIPLGIELDAEFGHIEIDGDGDIFYNDKDITGDIKDACDNDSGSKTTEQSKETENGDNADTGGKLP